MEIIGRVVKVTDAKFGENAKGVWRKITLIVNPSGGKRMLAFEVFGSEEEVAAIEAMAPETLVQVIFFIECEEYGDKWYTKLKAKSVTKMVKMETDKEII